MIGWIRELDGLLRGKKSGRDLLAEGTDHLAVRRHLAVVLVFGALYGVAMGLFAAIGEPGIPMQLLASAVKVPALFLLSLLVTLPSFLAFSALLGVRLGPRDAVRLIVAAILVNLTVLASFAPITAFFTVCTTSYPFMKVLNILFFVVAGAIGFGFFRRLVGNLDEARLPSRVEPAPPPPDPPEAPPPLPGPMPRRANPDERLSSRGFLRIWVVLYALVAAQMAWVLRPLVGVPDSEFVWFMERGGSFLIDLGETLKALFGG